MNVVMKRFLKAGLAVLICSVLLEVGAGCRRSSGAAAQFESVKPSVGEITHHVTASGTLSALVSVDVGSQVSGKIVSLAVDFNSPVRRGQIVAGIDSTLYEAAMKQAEAELASARATAVLKKQNLERKRILTPMKAASQLDLDQATAELAQAEATVMIKEAVLTSARANLAYCTITAPVDGVVISRKVDLGQTVIAAMTTPVLFTIARDLTKMNISASISEADIGQIKEGQTVEFTVDAFPDETFVGSVAQVRRAPSITQNVVTYETLITVDNPGQKLFPGMTADVSVLVNQRRNALKIPNAALRYTPPEGVRLEGGPPRRYDRGQRLIYTLGAQPDSLIPVLVKAGITDGVDTEILEGVDVDARIVVSTLSHQAKGRSFAPPPPPESPQ